MKKMGKRNAAPVLALCIALGLCGCSSSAAGEKAAETLVQGNVQEIYLGEAEEAYLELADRTREEVQQSHLAGLEMEAEYFAFRWGILDAGLGEIYADLDESLRNDIADLYKEIYSHTRYQIVSAEKEDETTYVVEISVDPIDVMEQAEALYASGSYQPLNDFWEGYAETDFSAMPYEEYMEYTHEYGRIVLGLVREQLPNLGYREPITRVIRVEADQEGVLHINGEDWKAFDAGVLYYP